MIRVPLIDTDSGMTLYKTYNLPIFHQNLGKSLQYKLEGNNLAVTRDVKYVTMLCDSEFMQCTLAAGHFCALNTALYHIDSVKWCLAAIFLKDDSKIGKFGTSEMTNITGTKAVYLDQSTWAICVDKSTHMEVRCSSHNHVKTLKPCVALVTLQPTCSAFSADIKFPPYFKQYSKGFPFALKSANLHLSEYSPIDFRIWKPFNLTNITHTEIQKSRKLEPAPAIPIDLLKTQIATLRYPYSDRKKSWTIHYIGGGSGLGFIIVLVICGYVYWRCKCHQKKDPRPPISVTYTDPMGSNTVPSREWAEVRILVIILLNFWSQ